MTALDGPAYAPEDDEVAFWRGFIEWWVREKDSPVPERAWEALDYAERKQDDWDGTNLR